MIFVAIPEVKLDSVKSAILNRGHHHLPCLHMSLVTAMATILKQSTLIRFQDELRQTVCEILEPRCLWSRSLESVTNQKNGNLLYTLRRLTGDHPSKHTPAVPRMVEHCQRHAEQMVRHMNSIQEEQEDFKKLDKNHECCIKSGTID